MALHFASTQKGLLKLWISLKKSYTGSPDGLQATCDFITGQLISVLNYLMVHFFFNIQVESLLFQFISGVSNLPDMSQDRPLRNFSPGSVLLSKNYPLKWTIQTVFSASCSPAIRIVKTYLGYKDAAGSHVESVAKGSLSSTGKWLVKRVLILGLHLKRQFVRELMETVQRNGIFSACFSLFFF